MRSFPWRLDVVDPLDAQGIPGIAEELVGILSVFLLRWSARLQVDGRGKEDSVVGKVCQRRRTNARIEHRNVGSESGGQGPLRMKNES